MILIPVEPIPNQSFAVRLDGIEYEIAIKTCRNVMAMSISAFNNPVVLGQRIIPGYPIIPYRYKSALGNFVFNTADSEYPQYNKFGVDQFLLYASVGEL
jgi:hypothetical protein